MIHSHDHPHDHDHASPAMRRESRLLFAFALTVLMLLAEAIGGVVSHSLALLADAGHMLVDAGALMFAWLGAHYARRPADAKRSFGYARL
ncbi:MAG TPA: cation transporter, partial [Rhodanobacteraceae bacterium]